jgi:hypothetical protein
MSQVPDTAGSLGDLQFNTAEGAEQGTVGSQSCAVCGQPISSRYFALGDQMVCPTCCEQLTAPPGGTKLGRVLKASAFGLVAGLAGAAIWFAIRRAANLQIGLVAILVGFMVGKAVRIGSGGQGGRGYQVLAVAITYCCISANYMPDIVEAVFEKVHEERAQVAADKGQAAVDQNAAPAEDANALPKGDANPAPRDFNPGQALVAVALALVLIFGLALALPFMGAMSPIGLLIIAFALWEAWKFNAHQPLPISGPYELAPDAA